MNDASVMPQTQNPSTEVEKIWITRLKITATSISLFVRLIASFIVAAYDGWLRRQHAVVRRVKDNLLVPTVVVFSSKLSLSAISAYHSNKFDPILQTFRIINFRQGIKWFPKKVTTSNEDCCEPEPEKSVHCEILYDPLPQPVRADVVFIHGLHGSIVHTWKQGLWAYRKQVQNLPLQHKRILPEKSKSCSSLPTTNIISSNNNENITDQRRNSVQIISNNNNNNNISCKKSILNDSDTDEILRSSQSLCMGDEDHDLVLENITDIINNIDDKIKETTKGSVSWNVVEKEPYSPCWPRDWLPKDCPGVRVIAVNYTTDPFLWRPVWITKRTRTSMTQRSREMIDHLIKIGVGQHPIVWVGHSKGGLFVKQMLVDAKDSEDSRLSKFIKQTKGIMFYSVPHRGSSLAHINLPLLRQSVELTEVKKDCQEVLELHDKFMKLYEEKSLTAEVYSFVETILTFMFITNVRVVSVDSADLGLGAFQGVNIDHREICKPLNRNCFLYKELANLINRVV